MNTRSPQRPQSQRQANDRQNQPPKPQTSYPVICGIYMLQTPEGIYVGQAVDVYGRGNEHADDLEAERHANYRLQEIWRRHGRRSIKLYLIQECNRGDLDKYESYWISRLGQLNIVRPRPAQFLIPPRNQRKFLINLSEFLKEGSGKGKSRSPSSGCAMQLLWIILAALVGANIAVYFGFHWLTGFWIGAIGWLFVMSMSTRR